MAMQRSQVSRTLELSRRAPALPGVYAFLGADDRIMYVGMAHDLQRILYRYQGLPGRQGYERPSGPGSHFGSRVVACG